MIGQKIIIGFKHDMAFLIPGKALTFEQLGLSGTVESFKAEAFWTIEILNFDLSQRKLVGQILLYEVGAIKFPKNQMLLIDELSKIEKVIFRGGVNTLGLLKTSGTTTPSKVFPTREFPVVRSESIYDGLRQSNAEPTAHTLEEVFSIFLKNVRFKQGGVSFTKKLRNFNTTLEITIENPEIREEFDAIKNYFTNVLKTKKIKVIAKIEVVNGKITSVKAESAEIAKIDQTLIENVKLDVVRQIIRKKISTELEKSLFTIEELFDTFATDEVKSNVFYNDDKELIEDLLKISKSKHYHHLRFLSKKHAHELQKIRFVQSPFSFIFLVKANKNYHIIWETLNTKEATYIWSIGNDTSVLDIAVKKIEDVISKIKACGKRIYINETDDSVIPIHHDYADATGGFEKWKRVVEMVLI